MRKLIQEAKIGKYIQDSNFAQELAMYYDEGYQSYLEHDTGHRMPKPVKHSLAWFIWQEFKVAYLALPICKIRGHRWEMECGGDAESGPITYSWCGRCGKTNKPIFGM